MGRQLDRMSCVPFRYSLFFASVITGKGPNHQKLWNSE